MNKALLVGINNYPDPENHLNGCINDINDMADFLVSNCGFSMNEIRLLADDRATKENIVERLMWLTKDVNVGDRIVFHYSGHGAQMASRNDSGEVDNLDEVICPWDFDWTHEFALKDKEFAELFKVVPEGVSFIWISDSCHSGGLSKDFFNPKTISRKKAMVPPPDIAWRNNTAKSLMLPLNSLSKAANPLNVALISGCKSDQTSADAAFNNRYNGALTFCLLKELQSGNGLYEPLNTVVLNINTTLKNAGYSQSPQLEGSANLMEKPFLNSK